MAKESLILFETSSCKRVGEAEHVGLDVYFPSTIGGWTDVLDCREAPYTTRTIEENCHYALHVRKPYILVESSYLEQQEAPSQPGS